MEPFNLLIVDDETDFRELLVEALTESGYQADGAENVSSAIERIKTKHYAIVFTDLNMPGGLSGLDLLKAIQEMDPKTFTIMMTGFATTEAAIGALKRGAYDFITKPFKLAELEASLDRALDHYKTLRQNEAYQNHLQDMVNERTQEILALKDEIERLFEGFVHASIKAIEARDPSTSGHSSRVAALTVALARALATETDGPYAGIFLDENQLQELLFAGLLHDFGKIAVREKVLVKARKLDEERFERILQRLFQRELEELLRQMEEDWQFGRSWAPGRVAELLEARKAHCRGLIDVVVRCNEPKILPQEIRESLDALMDLDFLHWRDGRAPVFEPEDLLALRIPKGSLSDEEREEINSHVTHSYQFLQEIPWRGVLSEVPSIAYAHHERLNGRGYPRGLHGGEIPLQAKIMAIADVYDALVASDRPYKEAVTVTRAIEILRLEAEAGLLDGELLRIFLDRKIYELTIPEFRSGRVLA